MRPLLSTSLMVLAGMAAMSTPALAQPAPDTPAGATTSQPVPDTAQASPGIPGPEAVNPAPGSHGPYVGAGKQGFYDVDQRIASVGQQIGSLPASQRRQAASKLKAIKSEEAFKRSKYGELRDWDREHLTVMLDQLTQQFPALSASADGAGPAPAR
jgi:hypothetical protein